MSKDRQQEERTMGNGRLRARFWIELGLTVLSLILTIGTVVVHDWIEVLFQIDPDEGGGSLEAFVTVVAVAITTGFALAARMEWRRAAAART